MRCLPFFLLMLSLAFSYHGKSQTPEIDTLIQDIEAFYDTLDTSAMQTDFLFNRGFLTGYHFETWDEHEAMIFNYEDFDDYRTPVMRTNSLLSIPSRQELENEYNDIYYLDEQVSTIANPLIFLKGEYVKDTVIELHYDSGQALVFKEFNFLCAAPLAKFISQGQVNFKFHPQLIFTQDNIVNLSVDFDDNNGFQSISLNSETIVPISYLTSGEKNLIYRVVDSIGDTTLCYSYIDVLSVVSFLTDAIFGEVTDTTDTSGESFGSRSTNANGGLDYLFYKGLDNKSNKPFIFVEGFDVLNTTDARKSYSRMIDYIPLLRSAGYDVYITNFKDGRGNIFDNINYIQHFIQFVVHKQNSAGQNFVEKHEGAMLCLSMGGIISRGALAGLESAGYDHQIGTLITSDTPHKGASVAPFLQTLYRDILQEVPSWIVRKQNWAPILSIFNTNKYIPKVKDVYDAINSPAALQMVVQHNNPVGQIKHTQLRNWLNTVGWPQNCRKVSLVCGSNRGNDHGFGSGTKMIQKIVPLPPITYFHFWGKCSPLNKTNFKYWEFVRLSKKRLPKYRRGKKDFGDKPWENAPGSMLVADIYSRGQKVMNIPMMVSTLSAMDVSDSYFTGANFYNYDRNSGKGKSYFINNNLTPFDEVYSVNVPGKENMQHPFIFQETIIRDIICFQELMIQDYYLQNRTFDKDRDIECGGKMVVGSDVLPSISVPPYVGKNYLYNYGKYIASGLNTTETEKSQNIGIITVKSGIELLLEAKDKITFKTGFKVENGAEFNAKVDGTNPNTRSDNSQTSCGQINTNIVGGERTFTVSNAEEAIQWQMVGYNSMVQSSGNSFTIPKGTSKGQYSIEVNTIGCSIPTIVISVAQAKIETKNDEIIYDNIVESNLILSPNPADKEIVLQSSEIIEVVEVFDMYGKEIEAYKPKLNKCAMNISNYGNGTYLVRAHFKNRDYETKRFVVSH